MEKIKITFNDLAAIIEIAFNWYGYHLYEFEIRTGTYGFGTYIGLPSEDNFEDPLDAKKEKISKYFKYYKKLKFTYDFGDDWIHDIVVEKEVNEKLDNPICIKAKSGSYPEDCGGVYGYELNYGGEIRIDPNIGFMNKKLENYKEFAKDIYIIEIFLIKYSKNSPSSIGRG